MRVVPVQTLELELEGEEQEGWRIIRRLLPSLQRLLKPPVEHLHGVGRRRRIISLIKDYLNSVIVIKKQTSRMQELNPASF